MSKPRRFNPADALQAAAMARLHERIMGAGRAAEEGGRLRPGEAARALGDDADDAGGPSDDDADNQVPNPAPRASMGERLRGALPAPEAGDDPEAARRAAIRERLIRETSSALAPLRGSGRSGL